MESAPEWALCGATPAEAGAGHRLPKQQAAECRYWQPSPRNRIGVIVCDCDQVDPVDRVLSGHAPPPTAVVWNESNGHSHALYLLTSPVSCGPRSSQQAQQYLEAVWSGLEMALSADSAYGGLLSRGPHAPGHLLEAISGRSYELRELAAAIELPKRATTAQRLAAQHHDSRNRATFDYLRHLAYSHAHLSDAALLDMLTNAATAHNALYTEHPSGPLPARELLGIARSVWRWTTPRRERFKPQIPGAVDRSRQHSRDRQPPAPEATQKARQEESGRFTAARKQEATRAELRAAVVTLTQQGQPVNAKTLILVTGLSKNTVYAHSDVWN